MSEGIVSSRILSQRRKEASISAEDVRATFQYDPDTGDLLWKDNPKKSRNGKRAGHPHCGYITVRWRNNKHRVHRLIWLYHNGSWPTLIDHINGDRLDNRIENLRNVSHSENNQNISSARGGSMYVGVWRGRRGGWVSAIRHNKKTYNLGRFDTEEDAAKAYLDAKKRLHTYWATEVKNEQ